MSENRSDHDDRIPADHQEYSDILMHAPIGVFASTQWVRRASLAEMTNTQS